MTDEVLEIDLINSAIRGYKIALERNTTIMGEPLTPQTKERYAREIVILQGKKAAILGSMTLL